MWQPGWEGSLGENGYRYMYSWVPLPSTWNYLNIINGYMPIQNKKLKKRERERMGISSSVQFSSSVVSNSLWPHQLQHTRPPLSITNSQSLPKNSCPWSRWCHPTISFSVIPFSSPSPPALNLSQHQGLSKWVNSSNHMAKVLEFKLQH